MLTLAKPLPRKAESQAGMRTTLRACTARTQSRHPRACPRGMAPSHIRNCSDRSPVLPCVRRSRKSFAVQSRPIRAHSAAKPSRSANSAPRKFLSYAPSPPLARRAAQRETQTVLYSQCSPRQAVVRPSAYSNAASNSRGWPSYPLSLPINETAIQSRSELETIYMCKYHYHDHRPCCVLQLNWVVVFPRCHLSSVTHAGCMV